MSTANVDVRFGAQGLHTVNTGATEAPKAEPGLKAITLNPSVMETPIYADNTVFYTATGTNSVECEVTVVSVSDEFKINYAGEIKTVNGGVASVLGATNRKPFDMIFDSTGTKPRRILLRNCTVIGSIKHDYTTNTEGIEQQDDIITVSISGVPTADNKYRVWQEVYDINSEAAKELLKSVPAVPVIGTPAKSPEA